MAGDFSRSTFDRRKHYSSVRMQQGRVQLDSDWNEQVDITRHELETRARDFIGRSGAPMDSAGFGLDTRVVFAFDGKQDCVELHLEAGQQVSTREPFHVQVSARPGADGRGGTLLHLLDPAGHPQLRLAVDATRRACFFFGQGSEPVLSSDVLDWSRPRHLHVSFDGKGLQLQVDGQQVDSAPAPAPAGNGGTPGEGAALLYIGAVGGETPSDYFEGTIEHARLWREGGPLLAWPEDREGHGHSHHHHHHHHPHRTGVHPPRRTLALWIGEGRYYVDGILCENEHPLPFDAQPDLLDAQALERGLHLAVLDVWERLITTHEDPGIQEVALGGLDTAVRTRTVWQVRTVRADVDPDAEDFGEDTPEWKEYLARHGRGGLMRARHQPGTTLELPGNQLYRVEIHDGGERAGAAPDPTGAWPHPRVGSSSDQPETVVLDGADVDPRLWFAGRWVEVLGAGGRLLTRITGVDGGRLTLADPLPAALQGTEATLRPIASFKWSRNNGCDALPVEAVEGKRVRLQTAVGHHGIELRPGDMVEVLDERTVLEGEPVPLRRVVAISDDRLGVTLDAALPGGLGSGAGRRPLLRRWDRSASTPPQGALPVGGEWVELELGIQVQFDGTTGYRTGQHWLIPARERTDAISWPSDDLGPVARLPDGGAHHACLLALLRVDGDGHIVIEDRRLLFAPLTRRGLEPEGGEEGPATIDDFLRVLGSATIDGELSAGSITGHLAPRTVGSAQLHDEAVTAEKLAHHSVHPRHLVPELGLLPPGAVILTDSRQPPPGFEFTRHSMEISSYEPEWLVRRSLPAGGAARVALLSLAGKLYALLENGQLWRAAAADSLWELAGQMHPPRSGFGAAVLGNRIHVVGGLDDKGCPVATHQAYDPARDQWTELEPMLTPRSEPALAVSGEELFVLGGRECWPLPRWSRASSIPRPPLLSGLRRSSAAAEVYVSSQKRWLLARRLPTPVTGAGAAAREGEGELHLVGGLVKGWIGKGKPTAEHQVLDLSADRWEKRAPLRRPRTSLGLCAADERLYAVGGSDGDAAVATVERYNPSNDAWSSLTPLPLPVEGTGTAPLAGELLVAGGLGPSGPLASVWSFAVASQMFLHRKSLAEEGEASTTSTQSGQSGGASTSSGASLPSAGPRSALPASHFRPPLYQEPGNLGGIAAVAAAAALILLAVGGGYIIPRIIKPGPVSADGGTEPGPIAVVDGGLVAPVAGVMGIDVSQWQGTVDWPAVEQAGVGFAFVKATEGKDYVDPLFKKNWSALGKTGLVKGAYHFFHPEDDPEAQAELYLRTVALTRKDLPAVLDVETTGNVPDAVLAQRMSAWLNRVQQETGRRPVLYVYPAFWRQHLAASFSKYAPLWIADDAQMKDLPPEWSGWVFWQYTDMGALSGVSTCVDRNWFAGTAEELRLFATTGLLPVRASKFPRGQGARCRHMGPDDTHPPVPPHPPTPPVVVGTPDAGSPQQQVLPFTDGMPEPQIVKKGKPLVYTRDAIEARVEGLAIALCVIGTDGHLYGCRMVKSLKYLDDAILTMMLTRVYKPIVYQGRTVAVEYPFYLHIHVPEEGEELVP